MITNEIDDLPTWMVPGVNPLQRVVADAMSNAGYPLEARGSKAWLARQSGVSETIVGYIFNRENYLPDSEHRAKLARALGIPKGDLDAAGAAIRGLRAHAASSDVLSALDDVRVAIVLSEGELSDAELKRAKKQLDRLAAEVAERLRGNRPQT